MLGHSDFKFFKRVVYPLLFFWRSPLGLGDAAYSRGCNVLNCAVYYAGQKLKMAASGALWDPVSLTDRLASLRLLIYICSRQLRFVSEKGLLRMQNSPFIFKILYPSFTTNLFSPPRLSPPPPTFPFGETVANSSSRF